MEEGSLHETKCGQLRILEYRGCNEVICMFTETGYKVVTTSGNIRKGLVKDRLSRTTYGVGILGIGEHTRTVNRQQTKCYTAWLNMLARCYSGKLVYKSYKDVTVCEDWQNFQNFADWWEENYVEGFVLDKDIRTDRLVREYSPETCMFVDVEENARESAVKYYSLLSPDGIHYRGWNVQTLCGKFGLDSGGISKVLTGKQKTHKGWRKLDD